jgi:transcriptional regulator with XRE-family HTH domain
MSQRSSERRITSESRVLRFLRCEAGFTYRQAAKRSGLNVATLNHLENGRIKVHQRHLDRLLPCYDATLKTYQLFVAGGATMPKDLKHECLEAIKALSEEQLRSVLPILLAMSPKEKSGR